MKKRVFFVFLLFLSVLAGFFLKIYGFTLMMTIEPSAVIYTEGYFRGWIDKNSPLFNENIVLSDLKDRWDNFLKMKVPVIISSYALFSQENNFILKDNLEKFVRNGGSVIVFGQQYGRHVEKIIPVPRGEKLKVYGWRESDSGYMGVYIDRKALNHPLLSFAKRRVLYITHDGYFGKYPKGTKVILRRLGDGKPVFVYYRYGKGYVFLSSIGPSEGYRLMRLTEDSVKFTKNLLIFARAPRYRIKMYKKRENLKVSLLIKAKELSDKFLKKRISGNTLKPGSLRFIVYSPSGKIVKKLNLDFSDLRISKNGFFKLNFVLENPKEQGIYSVSSRVGFNKLKLSLNEKKLISGSFAIYDRKSRKSKMDYLSGLSSDGLKAEVKFDRDFYRVGEEAVITLNLRKAKPVKKSYFIFANNGENEVFKRIVVGKTQRVKIRLKNGKKEKYFFGIYGKNGKKIMYIKKSVKIEKQNVLVFLDREEYSPGDTMTINFKADRRGKFIVKVFSSLKKIEGKNGKIKIKVPLYISNYSDKVEWHFISFDEEKTVSGVISFKIKHLRFIVKEFKLDKSKYLPEDTIKIYFRGLSSGNAKLIRKTWIIKPSGDPYYEKKECECCSYAEKKIINIKKGMNEVRYGVKFKTDEGGIHRVRVDFYDLKDNVLVNRVEKTFMVETPYILSLGTDKDKYEKEGENVKLYIDYSGTGKAELFVYLNEGIKDKESLIKKIVNLKGKGTLKILIDSSKIKWGYNNVRVKLKQGGIVSEKGLNFTYEPPVCDFSVDVQRKDPDVNPFERVYGITIENAGDGVCERSSAEIRVIKGRKNPNEKMKVLLSYEKEVKRLEPGESEELIFPLKLYGFKGNNLIKIRVNGGEKIREKNYYNNRETFFADLPEVYLHVDVKRDINVIMINNNGEKIKGELSVIVYGPDDKILMKLKEKVKIKDREKIEIKFKVKKNISGAYYVKSVFRYGNKKVEDERFL